jgi:hypothetical protein
MLNCNLIYTPMETIVKLSQDYCPEDSMTQSLMQQKPMLK